MGRSNLVFRDLYDFIQTAQRDRYGMCYPFGECSKSESFAFHIYEGLIQVNIVTTGDNLSIANFIFDGEFVKVVPVMKGIADYQRPLSISIESPIDSPMSSNRPLSGIDLWTSHLGPKGKMVQEVLRDALCPFVNEGEIQEIKLTRR